jgi:hypothetical protein
MILKKKVYSGHTTWLAVRGFFETLFADQDAADEVTPDLTDDLEQPHHGR